MQQEQEGAENAPLGFKSYDAGDYRLFVPFPSASKAATTAGRCWSDPSWESPIPR